MSDSEKVQPRHLQRCAYIYVRQSTATQVACNRESADRQYKLRDRALQLGWSENQVIILDQDSAQRLERLRGTFKRLDDGELIAVALKSLERQVKRFVKRRVLKKIRALEKKTSLISPRRIME